MPRGCERSVRGSFPTGGTFEWLIRTRGAGRIAISHPRNSDGQQRPPWRASQPAPRVRRLGRCRACWTELSRPGVPEPAAGITTPHGLPMVSRARTSTAIKGSTAEDPKLGADPLAVSPAGDDGRHPAASDQPWSSGYRGARLGADRHGWTIRNGLECVETGGPTTTRP